MLSSQIALVLAVLCASVQARCFCPPTCSFPPCTGKSDFVRMSCNDLEAQAECNFANAMVKDMTDSMGRNADLYLNGLLLKNASVTPLQVSYLRTKLSEAMEWGKPVGDCANGLTTNAHLANINDICYSPPLFEQCDLLAKTVPQYFASIHNVLNTRLLADGANASVTGIVAGGALTPLAAEFVSVMKARDSIQRESNKIRCKGYNSTVDSLLSAAPSGMVNVAVVLVVGLASIVLEL